METPFMEHPTGEFASAIDAMADAIDRLRSDELPRSDAWISFCAQGAGESVDAYRFVEIRLRRDELVLSEPIDPDMIVREADVPRLALQGSDRSYSIASATPDEAACLMDAMFRHLGICPHPDEGEDYAVGAEWQ